MGGGGGVGRVRMGGGERTQQYKHTHTHTHTHAGTHEQQAVVACRQASQPQCARPLHHDRRMPSLAADDTIVPTASASATLAASSSPDDATVGTAADAAAAADYAAGIGMAVGTDPVLTATAPPTAERTSSFLSCIRRHAADGATATAASAAEALASPPPSDLNRVDGAMPATFSTTNVGMHDDTDSTPPSVADGSHVSTHPHADEDDAVATRSAWEVAIPTPKKRRVSRGPTHETSRKAFLRRFLSP